MSGSERKRQHSRDERERERRKKEEKIGFCDLQDVYKETFKEQKLQIHGGNWGHEMLLGICNLNNF